MPQAKFKIFIICLLSVLLHAENGWAAGDGYVRKSLKQVKTGNLAEAHKILKEAQLKKQDDFGVDYVYSLYFLSPYQKTLKLDSSYIFCLSAIQKFEKEEEKGRKKYVHLEIDSAELFSRKDYLDSLGFSQAQRLESEAAYQYFLEKFPQSRLAETAKQKRASLAFQRAKSENSYDAFMAFLDKYPDAEQARSAKEISDLLVFENTARKGKIADWEAFIEKNPNNPYVLKAQNRLFELSTVEHKPESYYAFIQNYPENPNISKAWEWIFFLDPNPKNLYQMEQKYRGFPILPFETRFLHRHNRLITYIERKRFGMMQGNGQGFIKPIFDSIPADYKCDMVWAGFVKLFKGKKATLFAYDSLPISEGEYDNAEFFADGLLKTLKGGRQGLISMTGYQILAPRYESIIRLNANLLSIQQGSKFYLFTTKGQKIDIQGVDEIIPAENHFAIRRGEKFALVSESDILKNLQNEPIDPQFKFTAVKKLAEGRLLLFKENEVNYFIKNRILVLDAQPTDQFSMSGWGLQIFRNDEVNVVDSNGNTLPKSYQTLRIHGHQAVARMNTKFGIIQQNGNPILEFAYDSISLILRKSFLARRGNKKFVVFENGSKIYFSGSKLPEVLRYNTGKSIVSSYFIVLTDSLDRKAVFNARGRQLLPFFYDQISLLDQHLFSISDDKKVGVADTSGSILIKPSLSGASPINRDFICIARGKNFFIINPYSKKLVPGTLTSLAKPFGQSKWFFIVRIKDKAGLMDGGGKLTIPPVYEEIMYWNPTRCLVKKNGFWYFYQFDGGKELVKAITSIRVLMERENETVFEVESDKKVGIVSTLRGDIAPTESDEIIPFEGANSIYFFAGKRVQSSSVYNLSYIDQNGGLIKTQLLTEEEYEQIVCD